MPAHSQFRSEIFELQDDLEFVDDFLYQRGQTDGLPVVPPTEDRVNAMINAAGLNSDHLVAKVGPSQGAATVEKLAINAVLAGCRPEHMAVVIAAVEAMTKPEFNLDSVQTTTNPCTVALVLNGPIRQALDINFGRGCLGPGHRSNAVLGRAIRFILLNIGGGVPGDMDKATHGFPGKYTLCFGEDEASSPWEPLHVERGFAEKQSTVTVMSVNTTLNIITSSFVKISDMLASMANALSLMGTNNATLGAGEPMMLLSPGHANLANQAGMSKSDVKAHLYEECGFPASLLPDDMVRRDRINRVIRNGLVRPVAHPDDIVISVAGGSEPYHATFMPTFGDSLAVTQEIRVSQP